MISPQIAEDRPPIAMVSCSHSNFHWYAKKLDFHLVFSSTLFFLSFSHLGLATVEDEVEEDGAEGGDDDAVGEEHLHGGWRAGKEVSIVKA